MIFVHSNIASKKARTCFSICWSAESFLISFRKNRFAIGVYVRSHIQQSQLCCFISKPPCQSFIWAVHLWSINVGCYLVYLKQRIVSRTYKLETSNSIFLGTVSRLITKDQAQLFNRWITLSTGFTICQKPLPLLPLPHWLGKFSPKTTPISYRPPPPFPWRAEFCPMITPKLDSDVWTYICGETF